MNTPVHPLAQRHHVLWLEDAAATSARRAGGKAAALAALVDRLPIPPGFVVVGAVDPIAVALAYAELGDRVGSDEALVAVRSSATDEDGRLASFAGQYETILGVRGIDELLDAIARCRASAHSDRALQYRRVNGLDTPAAPLPVLVQLLVPADAAAVVFSVNPLSPRSDEVLVNAAFGLGESIVGGTVTPDEFALARASLHVARRTLADKRRMTVRAPGGSREVDVPAPLRRLPSISDEQARAGAPGARARARARLCRRPRGRLDRRRPASPSVPTDHGPWPAGGSMTPQQTDATVVPFPVVWTDPADEALFWEHDAMHFPDALTPMEAAMIKRTFGHGLVYGARAYHAPIERVEVRAINGYHYASIIPTAGTPDEMAAQGALAGDSVRAALGRLEELWCENVLPEIRAHLGFWDSFDLGGATRAAFVAHLDETWARLTRLWELHFVVVLPAYLAMSEFDETYRGLFPEAGPLDSYRLLEGLPNMTVEVGQALWQLSRVAIAEPAVGDVFMSRPADEIPAALYGSAVGRAFLADLEAFLDRYGRRGDKWSILSPSWTEDPTPAIERLRDFVRRPESEAPAMTTHSAAAGREQAIAAARDRLRDYPAQIAGRFEGMLAAAQAATPISEDHNFWIDNMSIHHLRAVLLEAGQRLVEDGTVAVAGDVFMLDPEELRAALAAPGEDLRPLVRERLAQMARQRTMTPPATLGTRPSAPLPDDPFTRMATKFNPAAPPAPAAEDELRGSAGSAGSSGTVRGTARVITSITEAGRIQPGEILVAQATAPPWTPLFATVAAVVTDTGGVLSHCAVVAREYAIPAVVGTGVATSVIADGQTIEVDGDAGIVRIV
jgi:phosphohistidine swiveling domain-containing protein